MKKTLIALLGAATLLLASCSSETTTEKHVENLYKNKDVSAYSLSGTATVVKEDLTSADVWTTAETLTAAKVTEYEGVCDHWVVEIKNQTVMGEAAWDKTNTTFAACNAKDKLLAKEYGDSVEYLIEGGKATASYEGSHSFVSTDAEKFDNGAYAFSYVAKYNSVGLLENASMIISFVQKGETGDATFMRTYKLTLALNWQKA